MKSCGRRNVRKHRDIKNGEKYILLDISSKIDYMDKREVTSSESKGYILRPGKGLTTSLSLNNKGLNKKKGKGLPLLKLLISISGSCSRSSRIQMI